MKENLTRPFSVWSQGVNATLLVRRLLWLCLRFRCSDPANPPTVSSQREDRPRRPFTKRPTPKGGEDRPLDGHDQTLQVCLISQHYRPVASSSSNERPRFTISSDILTIGRLWLEEWRMRAHDCGVAC